MGSVQNNLMASLYSVQQQLAGMGQLLNSVQGAGVTQQGAPQHQFGSTFPTNVNLYSSQPNTATYGSDPMAALGISGAPGAGGGLGGGMGAAAQYGAVGNIDAILAGAGAGAPISSTVTSQLQANNQLINNSPLSGTKDWLANLLQGYQERVTRENAEGGSRSEESSGSDSSDGCDCSNNDDNDSGSSSANGSGRSRGSSGSNNDGGETTPTRSESSLTAADVKSMFPESAHANIDKYLPKILDALAEQGIDDPEMVRYAIATIGVESGNFEPISEIGGENRSYGQEGFFGRGFIQLTHQSNYEQYGDDLGVDLVGNPDQANDPDVAARVLARYLKNNEGRLRDAFAGDNLAAARKVVNGGTNGLSEFTNVFNDPAWNSLA